MNEVFTEPGTRAAARAGTGLLSRNPWVVRRPLRWPSATAWARLGSSWTPAASS